LTEKQGLKIMNTDQQNGQQTLTKCNTSITGISNISRTEAELTTDITPLTNTASSRTICDLFPKIKHIK